MKKDILQELRAVAAEIAPDDDPDCFVAIMGKTCTAAADEIETLRTENAALMEACRGRCYICEHAEPYDKAPLSPTLRACPHMKERNVLAATGYRRCAHWAFKAPEVSV